MTDFFFACLLFFAIGVLVGRLFWKLNPFLMLIGIFIGTPMLAQGVIMNAFYGFVMVAGVLFGLHMMHKRDGNAGFSADGNGFSFRSAFDFVYLGHLRREAGKFRQTQREQDEKYDEYSQYRDHMHQQKQRAEQHARESAEQAQREKDQARQKQQQYEQQQESYKQQTDEQARSKEEELHRQRQKFEQDKKNYEESVKRESESIDTRSPYQMLGVNETANQKDIKKAFQILANRYHPDKNQHMSPRFRKEAEVEFVKIKRAYDAIKGGA